MYSIWFAGSMVFYGLGVYAWTAKEAVKFWNTGQQIQVCDVKKYNHAVAKLWVVAAAVFDVIGLPLLAGQNSAWIVFLILGTVAWTVILMAVYVKIEGKYRV